jgi:hypothetical protein
MPLNLIGSIGAPACSNWCNRRVNASRRDAFVRAIRRLMVVNRLLNAAPRTDKDNVLVFMDS